MECKVQIAQREISSLKIGIYPEWNVKLFYQPFLSSLRYIGIYPEWNVKPSGQNWSYLW